MPYLNDRALPSLARHFPANARRDNPYFSPAVAGSLRYLAAAQKAHHTSVWIQYGGVENLHDDIAKLVARMRADGVDAEVDVVPGGVHLDAGMAYALRERGPESSWVRFIAAVKRYA